MTENRFQLLIAIALTLLLTMGVGITSVSAKPTLTIPSAYPAVPGEKVIIPIKLTGMESESIGGYSFRISYDYTILSNPKAITIDTLSEGHDSNLVEATPPTDGIGNYAVAIGFGFFVHQDGIFLKVQFDVSADFNGESAITFEDRGGKTVLITSSFELIDTNFVDGYITQGSMVMKGDLDANGIVDMPDLILLLNYIVGNITEFSVNKSAADLDINGEINIFDAVKMYQYLAGNISEL